MKNKLGLNIGNLLFVERSIVNLKMNLLDEYFTFNQNIFSLEYLKQLHKFLFSDIYYDDQIETREFSVAEESYIKSLLDMLKDACLNNSEEIDNVLQPIEAIWDLQPFYNGNTRTCFAYLCILNKAFYLNINIDLNKEIESCSLMFKKENFVNQKRLTKIK